MAGMKDALGDRPYATSYAGVRPGDIAAQIAREETDIPAEVYRLFEAFTLQAIKAGMNRFSADAVLHRIRWEVNISRGLREFKCNDHWTALLSRWFMDKHPAHQGFFETRKRKSVAGGADG